MQLGTIVLNPRAPHWGPGKIIHVGQSVVHVFFRDAEGASAKRLKPDHLELAPSQTDPILDNLPPFTQKGDMFVLEKDRITASQAISFFLNRYPAGFDDPAYIGTKGKGERHYKWAAHQRYVELFGRGQLTRLLKAKNTSELASRLLDVGGKTNLLFPTEAAAYREGLLEGSGTLHYFEAFAELLEDDSPKAFDDYAEALAHLKPVGATTPDKWPVATLMPFLAQPATHVFVKPLVMQEAAARLAFDIRYDSRPNSRTYTAIRTLCATYATVLQPLRPKDNIDITSFLWLVSSAFDKYQAAHANEEQSIDA